MRILDDGSDKKLDTISVFLTKEEAIQLRGYLSQLIDKPKLQHAHLSSGDYKKEVTICIYDEKNLEGFHPRSIKLIEKDE
ncbi:MAG: hypothetical protein H7A41_04300 [Chlamydiales bacterium]|nr:hypothetical protein [Chlamydiales bacterium]